MNVIMSFKLRYTCTPAYVCPSFCGIRYFEQTPVDTRAPNTTLGGTGQTTGVLHIYQQPRACERYVHDKHWSNHISPLHFCRQI